MKTAYTVCRPVHNHHLVRERDRRRLRELVRVGVGVMLVGTSLLGYTWLHLELVRIGYRIEALERQVEELERQERQLGVERAFLENPQRIEQRAVAELGLAAPRLEQVVFIDEVP